MDDMLQKRGISGIEVSSAATSTEEIGNGIHYGARRKLTKEGVPLIAHEAHQITAAEGRECDLIIAMDVENLVNLRHMLYKEDLQKVHLLLDYTAHPRNIADPWYTGNFDETYDDIVEGCTALIDFILTHSSNV